jgi:hypothetical protein
VIFIPTADRSDMKKFAINSDNTVPWIIIDNHQAHLERVRDACCLLFLLLVDCIKHAAKQSDTFSSRTIINNKLTSEQT